MSRSCFVFDLDSTLYPRSAMVEKHYAMRIKEFLAAHFDINFDQENFEWKKVAPDMPAFLDKLFARQEALRRNFCEYACDVDMSSLAPDPKLAQCLLDLPQAKYILTDSSPGHVQDTLQQLQIDPAIFAGIFHHFDAGFQFKSNPLCYQRFLQKFSLQGKDCVMFEDVPNNLVVAHQLGMATVLITPVAVQEPHIDHCFTDIHDAIAAISGLEI